MAKKIALTVFTLAFVVLVAPAAMAEEAAASGGSVNQWIAISCAFALGFASAVCGIAQSIAIKSAAEGISRNPGSGDQIRGMLILGLAFIESLAIYVLLIAFMLYFKWA